MFVSGFTIILLSSITTTFSHVHDCITPNSTVGICTPLKNCPQLKGIFEKVTSENYVFLRRSQCGYSEDEPEVCCPKGGTYKPFQVNETEPERYPKIPVGNRFSEMTLPAPPDCGIQSFENRIHGGEVTAIDEFPWMALLGYGNKNFACGGVLINSRYVLTAAHCAVGETEKQLGGLSIVRLGEYNIESDNDCDAVNVKDCAPPPIDVKIEKKIIHPDYDPKNPHQYHDIALLKLAELVDFNDFVFPVCLAKSIPDNLLTSGKFHFVSGWGQTEKKRNSPIKLKLKVPIVTPNSCSEIYNRFGIRIGQNQLCAGGQGGKDSCGGDSGGPLTIPAKIPRQGSIWFCSGIVSIGPSPCATKNIPGIYTKVMDYYEWIVANAK